MTEKEALNLYRDDDLCERCEHSDKEGDDFPCSRCCVLLAERSTNYFDPVEGEELIDLTERLGRVIAERCNTVGCKDCDMGYGDGINCSATDLQSKIMDLEEQQP